MSCATCKHWHWMPTSLDPRGYCLRMTSQYEQNPASAWGELRETLKSKNRKGPHSKSKSHIEVTWPSTATSKMTSLSVAFRCDADFTCGYYVQTKKKRSLPVVQSSNRKSRFERMGGD